MSIIYRSEKGAPLTSEELDGNFRELETKIKFLDDHQEVGEGLAKVQLHQDTLTFIGSYGTDFGSFPLPKTILSLRGGWRPQTLYQKHDLVTYDTGLYSCIDEHTSMNWTQDHGKWQVIFSSSKPSVESLSLYEKATLPKEESLGKMGLLMDEETPTLIFFNGKCWQRLMKGEPL